MDSVLGNWLIDQKWKQVFICFWGLF